MYLELNKNLTEHEEAIKTQIHTFAKEVLRPASLELDQLHDPSDVIGEGSRLWDVFRQAYQLGYHTAQMPERLGGAGLSPLARHIYNEEMGWGAADFAVGNRRYILPVQLRGVHQERAHHGRSHYAVRQRP